MGQENVETIRLGHAKLLSSRIGIGTWAIGGGWGPQPETQSLEALQLALSMGCLLIDTAPPYGNGRAERLVAQAIKEREQRPTVLTKIPPLGYRWAPAPGTPVASIYPSKHILEQVEGSLQRLQVDCLDGVLFQTWCPGWLDDLTWYETIMRLQRQGKIRTFGVSVSDHRPDDANDVIEAGLVDIIEASYSILDQRAAYLLFPLAERYHISVIARSPLASGALAEDWHEGMRFQKGDWRRRVFRDEVLRQTVSRVARLKAEIQPTQPLAQFALRFCLSHPAVSTVIVGVQNREHVLCNLEALQFGPLPKATVDQIITLWQEEFSKDVRTSVGKEGEDEARYPQSAVLVPTGEVTERGSSDEAIQITVGSMESAD
jgi:aryl-alcohol dehydrogenase-like predicted oxidoreductase